MNIAIAIILLIFCLSTVWLIRRINKKKVASTIDELPVNSATLVSKGTKAFMNGRYDDAFEILEPAARENNLKAQQILAKMYYAGNGVEADIDRYYYWLNKAAENGDKSAKMKVKKRNKQQPGNSSS